MLTIPDSYGARVRSYAPDAEEWLRRLPGLITRLLDEWGLTRDGSRLWHGNVAVVIPVLLPDHTPAALKVSYPSPESAMESAALARWDGRGAVRMLRADPDEQAILLERLDPTRSLLSVPVPQSIPIWGELMRGLSSVSSGDDFDTLADLAARWETELPELWRRLGRPCPQWLIEDAVAVCREQAGSPVLVHTDLHFENVLACRDDWRAIDPKPLSAVGEFAVAPMLWNRLADLDGRRGAGLRARCDDLADSAGLDRELSRRWSIAREVENHLDYLRNGEIADAQRSLWVATALSGREDPGVDPAALATP
ncbi:aminoglycoside phosphotransferase family protein [Rhodococcus maanshanensis]|uniref:Streptomycin 6-kinase n=1 Tax=Rhodococcus maanshanensis TaxID=183556 RepID=A0A1H7KJA2_9NOCA|nr:aminoglycoside phosphotransferase family protein [Rhodococcus maanshanensis]SEK85997.1 streptomycin 6-kinase [Rhodococcus maanshanensis]